MAFIFSTSHLPDLERSAEEEDDDDMKPMPRAGGVRAFSHLPQPVRAQADASPLWGRGVAPNPLRSASPTSPAPSDLRDQDDPPPPEAGLDDAPDSGSQEPEDSSPWHMPRLSAKDLLQQGHDEDPPDSSLNGPTLKPWENPARSSGFDGTPPADRSATGPRSSGFSPSPQDLRAAFQSPAPGSPVGQAPAQDNRPALPRGRIFEKRPTPGLRDQGSGQFQKTEDKAKYHNLVYRSSSPEDEQNQRSGFFQKVADTQYLAQAKTGTRQTQPSSPALSAKGGGTSAQPPAQGSGPTPPTQGGGGKPQNPGTAPAPQGGGSLAKYRQEKQKLLDQLQADKKLSDKKIKEIQKKIASITRNMESIALAAHLINHTKQKGEADIDPESIDENSEEFKNRARTAIHRLHGGSAPWMDRLAENFGEKEGPKGGPANQSLVEALGMNPTAAPWCGYALGKAMTAADITPPGAASWAGNWREWGQDNGPNAGGPHVGDVYHIKYDDGTGHVATVIGVSADGTQVFCLGGNQNDGLNISAYPIGEFNDPKKPGLGKYKSATIVFRKPKGQENNIPAPIFDYHADPAIFDLLAGFTR
jgi:hypothetical protein